jgi:hypothetical protein
MSLPLTAEQRDWMVEHGHGFSGRGSVQQPNPCVTMFGAGPAGAICKTCVHLFAPGGTNKTYYKCDLRHVTRGPATDHRVRWQACAKYQERAK